MRHEELKEMLPLYIDGGLDKDEVEMVEAHLAECEECRKELAIYVQNFDYLSMVEDVEVSDDFLASVMQRVAEEKRQMEREEESDVVRSQKQQKVSWWERLRDLLGYRMRIPVGAVGAVAAVVLLMLLVGPLADMQYQEPRGLDEYQYFADEPEALYDRNLKMPSPARMAEPKLMEAQEFGAPSAGVDKEMAQIERKLIQRANLTIEVKDLEASNEKVLEMVQEVKGYIASSSDWVSGKRQHSRVQIRVPADDFYSIMDELEQLGVITSRNISGDDVTEEYIDLSSRIKNLHLQEERYRQLLQQATKVEDILSIERELERVRSTLESLEGRLQYLDNQVSLSTIDLNLSEPEPITPTEWGIMKAMRQALREVMNSFYTMLIRLGAMIPYLVLLLVAYLIIRVVWLRRR